MERKARLKKVGFPISRKIIIIVLVSILYSTAFIGWLIYNASRRELVSNLKDSLERIAVTSAIFIDGDRHRSIGSPDDAYYGELRDLLKKIMAENFIDSPLYTLRKTEDRNELEAVVTTEPIVGLFGAKYRVQSEMRRAFAKNVVTSTDIYRTDNGIWISAYAPINDSAGNVAALLKIQRHAGYIRKGLRMRFFIVVLFCAFAFVMGSFLSIILIRQITTGIEKLNSAAASLEDGNYDTTITAATNDEIGNLAQTLENMRLSLREKMKELKDMWLKEKKAHLESILALSKAIEIRDPYTRGHIERVSSYSILIAMKMGVDDKKIEQLRYGCMLHDLGKLNVGMDILDKPGSLSDKERKKVEMHPIYGAEIIKGIGFLDVAREVALYHHERYDGKGYPFGLKGDKIPLLAKIVSLADAFDAMVSDRPYRKKMDPNEAFAIIKEDAGKKFDPQVCLAFLELRDEILKIKERYKD